MKKNTFRETLLDIKECYGGTKWKREINNLFPVTPMGCINFGYWELVPEKISLEIREASQIALYNKLLETAQINLTKNAAILEVGCGRGHGVFILSKQGYNGYGVDVVEAQIKTCVANYPFIKQKFKLAAANKTGLMKLSLTVLFLLR